MALWLLLVKALRLVVPFPALVIDGGSTNIAGCRTKTAPSSFRNGCSSDIIMAVRYERRLFHLLAIGASRAIGRGGSICELGYLLARARDGNPCLPGNGFRRGIDGG